MSIDTDVAPPRYIAPPLKPKYRRRPNGLIIQKETFARILLKTMFFLALWRATGMWYGYPAVFGEGTDGGDTLVAMKALLYSQIPLIFLYVWLEPRRVLYYVGLLSPLVLVVAASCLVSLLVSIDVGASIRGLAALTLFSVPPLFYRLRYGSAETFRTLGQFIVAAAFLNLIYTLAFPQFAVMGGSYAGMVKGLFYHKNGLGQFCAISIIVLVSFGRPRYGLRWSGILNQLTIAVLMVLVILSRSSTALVMVVGGVGTMVGVGIVQRVPGVLLRGGTLLALLFLLAFTVSSLYLGLAENIAEGFGKDLTFSGRTNIWDQLIPLVYEKPLFGYGYASFRQPWVMDQYVNVTFDAKSVHNTYLGIALEIGVPAMILWTVFAFMRVWMKIVVRKGDPSNMAFQAKEVVIILLVMTGGMMEASMMLAPNVLWPIMTIALPMTAGPIVARRRMFGRR